MALNDSRSPCEPVWQTPNQVSTSTQHRSHRARVANVAFAIHRLSAWGGLQRDAVRIAAEARDRGHSATLLCSEVDLGPSKDAAESLDLDGIEIVCLTSSARTNHRRASAFSNAVFERAKAFDAVLGFNPSKGLDLYFAGDRCYADRVFETRGPWSRLTPRYRALRALESEVFDPESTTRILLLAELQREAFTRWYKTPKTRFEVLAPGIDPTRRRSEDHAAARVRVRAELGIPDGASVLLALGSDFRRKGVDRSIDALGALADLRSEPLTLVICGADDSRALKRRARATELAHPRVQVQFVGPRADVGDLLSSSDALIHLARTEAGGAVLLESLAAGVPVVATDVCGYAPWVERSGAGRLISSGASAATAAAALDELLPAPNEASLFGEIALAFVAAHPELFTLHTRAVNAVERVALEGRAP